MKGFIRSALYARVSSHKQAEEMTIESQLAAIREHIRRDGHEIVAEFEFCDSGFSGADLLRPAMERLRDAISVGMIDRLYVHSPDRLARKLAHQAILLEEFSKHECQVVFLNQEGLPDTPEANLLLQMQGMIAEYERERMEENRKHQRERQDGAKHLLSGLLVCGCCGCAYCAHRMGSGKYTYYRCVGGDKYRHLRQPVCDNPPLHAAPLENRVWDELCQLLRNPERLREELERRRADNPEQSPKLQEIEKRVATLRGRIDRLIDAITSELIDRDEFEARITPLRAQHRRESETLDSLRGAIQNHSVEASSVDSLKLLTGMRYFGGMAHR